MCAGEEVAEVDKFAVVLVLDVDDTPSVLPTADLLAVYYDGFLRSDDSEGNDVLPKSAYSTRMNARWVYTLICAFNARSSSSNSSLSYGYIFKLWKANSSLICYFCQPL